ncbi:hypothetical protein C9374_007345 [Naegleria lovaniensis]|uniref:Crossover junction endonuclease MUS81 n=1 Tax=Naegleria lovaniensis TaxID=51637 RepID=A0AA88GMN6_NAELO|nr:uncharacterized protein C9374_007345 [Naegleria lovaniensis]KAG2379206.1 hypothetical protein C9374_007345 [Naegleria lovaniensis]
MPPKSRSKNSRSLVEEGSSSNIPIGRQLNPHIIKCLEDELSRCGQPSSSNHYYRTLRTAITSIEEHPKKIYNGTEAKALKGIGGKTAFKIDKYLKDNNIDLGVPSLEAEDISLTNQQYIHDSDTLCGVSSSSDNNGSNSRTKQKKRKRKYMPKFKSAAWAIMISMYRLCKENNCETVTKQQIVETCGQLTDTSMDRSTNGSNYTGWSSMKTLIDHEYVFSHKKGKYCLTKYGRRVARRLHKAEKDMFDKTFTWNESEEELSSSSSTYSQEEPYIQLEIHNDQMTSNNMDLLPPQNSQKLVNMTPSPANSVCTSIVDHVRSDRLSTPNNNLIPSFSAPIFIIDDENDDTDSRSNIDFHSFGIKAFYVDDHLKETMTLNNAKMSMDRKSGSLCRMVRIVVSCPHNRFILEEQIFDSIPQYSTREDDTIIATGLVKESRCTENANDLLHALIVDHSSLVLYTPNHKTLHSNHESITIVQSKKNSSLTDQETLIMLDTCQSKKRKKSYDDTQDMHLHLHRHHIAHSSHHHVSPPEPLSLSVLHHDNTRTDPSEFPVTNLSLNHSLTENTVLPVIDFNHYDSKSSNNESSRLQQHSNQQRHEPRYKIHLIVDQRERTGSNDRKMFCETLCKNHVDALIHQLGVGDMIWIAKPCSENSNELLSHHEEEEQQRVMSLISLLRERT